MPEGSLSFKRALAWAMTRARLKNTEGSAIQYNQRDESVESKESSSTKPFQVVFWCNHTRRTNDFKCHAESAEITEIFVYQEPRMTTNFHEFFLRISAISAWIFFSYPPFFLRDFLGTQKSQKWRKFLFNTNYHEFFTNYFLRISAISAWVFSVCIWAICSFNLQLSLWMGKGRNVPFYKFLFDTFCLFCW